MRTLRFGAVALLMLAGARPVPADVSWQQHLQAGRTAFARDDRAAAREHLLAVDSLLGGHTGAKWVLATLAARDGQRDDMLRWLRALAETGVARPVAADSTFARWREDPAFRAVAAQLDSNAAPLARATRTHTLGDASLLAEDVVWDARGGRFLVSSIHRRKIVAVDRAGTVTDLITAGTDTLWGMYGLALDARRGMLWASTAAGTESDGYAAADSGRTALLGYDLRSRRLRVRAELPRTAARQVLGDITVGDDGAVYASESLGGALYRLPPGGRALETLVPAGSFRSPQGLACDASGKRLYVADYSRGIAVVEVARGEVTWLAKPYSLAAAGCDGLYRDGDRLIAIQNGTSPHRVLELQLDAAGNAITRWRVLEQASPDLGEPNHGAIVGRDFHFIGNSGWDRVGDDGRLVTPADARPAVLLRLRLGN